MSHMNPNLNNCQEISADISGSHSGHKMFESSYFKHLKFIFLFVYWEGHSGATTYVQRS